MLPRLEKPNVSAIRHRLYDSLKDLVRADLCHVGQKLPTSRELAAHFNVSLATAQAAVRLLEKDGFVSCEVGRGTYVRRTLDPKEAPPNRERIPTIGALVAAHEKFDLMHPGVDWTTGILYGLQRGLMEESYALHLIPFFHPATEFVEGQKRVSKVNGALAGLVTFPFRKLESVYSFLDGTELPWVTINQYDHLCTSNYVSADYYGGGVEVGKLFARLGCRRVLFLKSSGDSYSAIQKENGLRDGLSAGGISSPQVEVRHTKSYFVPYGHEETARYLRETKSPPEAIFATGDLLALGAIKACQKHGRRVPEDVAVVGSTGVEAAEHSTPTLTTVQLPMIEMGIEAGRMLLSLIRKGERRVPGKIIPVQLIQRGSTLSSPGTTA